jgi:hypothetical protein
MLSSWPNRSSREAMDGGEAMRGRSARCLVQMMHADDPHKDERI